MHDPPFCVQHVGQTQLPQGHTHAHRVARYDMAERYPTDGERRRHRTLEFIVIEDLDEDIRRALAGLTPPQILRAINSARDSGLLSEPAHKDLMDTFLYPSALSRAERLLSAVRDKVAEDATAYKLFTSALLAVGTLQSLVDTMSLKLGELRLPGPRSSMRPEPMTFDSGWASNESAYTSPLSTGVHPIESAGHIQHTDTPGAQLGSVSEPGSITTEDSDSCASTILPLPPTFPQFPPSSGYAPALEPYSPDDSQSPLPEPSASNLEQDQHQVHTQETEQACLPTPELQHANSTGARPQGRDVMVNAASRPNVWSAGLDKIEDGARVVRAEMAQERAEHDCQIVELQSKLSDVTGSKLCAERKLKDTEEKLKRVSRESKSLIDDLKFQIEQKQLEVENLKEEVSQKQKENAKARKEYDAKIKKVKADAEEQSKGDMKNILVLEEALTKANSEKKVAEDDLRELQMKLREKEANYKLKEAEYKETIVALREEAHSHEVALLKMEAMLEKSRRKSDALQFEKERESLCVLMKSLEEENHRLRTQNSDSAVPNKDSEAEDTKRRSSSAPVSPSTLD